MAQTYINYDLNIPGYTRLQYIQSNGTQYIDTGFSDAAGIRVIYRAMFLDTTGGYIVGSHNLSAPYGRNGAYWSERTQWEFGYGETCEWYGAGAPNIIYDVDFKTTQTGAYLRVKGGDYSDWETFIETGGQTISAYNNWIFYNQYSQNVGAAATVARLYFAKIYNSSGELVRDFVPMRRDSDSVVGLYDLVNDVFYSSAVEGTNFTAGTANNNYENICYNGKTGYTELEFIQSDGNQYIDTGFIPNQDTRVQFSVLDSTAGAYYFGVMTNSGEFWKNHAFAIGNDDINLYTGYDGQGGGDGDIIPSGAHIVEQNKNLTIVDGTTRRTLNYTAFTAEFNLYLFLQNRSNSATAFPNGQTIVCKGCKIWDNGVLVRNFIPMKRNLDGAIGMMDTISGVFYENRGTGTFVAGPEKEEKIKELTVDDMTGYYVLDYIESTGEQYINPGVVGLAKWEIDIQFTKLNVRQLMGMNGSGGNYWGVSDANATRGTQEGDYETYGPWSGHPKAGNRDIIIDDVGNTDSSRIYRYLNGVLKQQSGITGDLSNTEYTLLALGGGLRCYAKLYGVKCYVGSTLVRNLIPVQRVFDDAVGLYDLVTRTFYGNLGSGAFIPGRQVGGQINEIIKDGVTVYQRPYSVVERSPVAGETVTISPTTAQYNSAKAFTVTKKYTEPTMYEADVNSITFYDLNDNVIYTGSGSSVNYTMTKYRPTIYYGITSSDVRKKFRISIADELPTITNLSLNITNTGGTSTHNINVPWSGWYLLPETETGPCSFSLNSYRYTVDDCTITSMSSDSNKSSSGYYALESTEISIPDTPAISDGMKGWIINILTTPSIGQKTPVAVLVPDFESSGKVGVATVTYTTSGSLVNRRLSVQIGGIGTSFSGVSSGTVLYLLYWNKIS